MITILHISDIHFGGPDPFGDQQRIAAAMITAAHASPKPPHLCVFSGDLAHSGKPEQFQQGQKWLTELMKPWKSTKLVIVPGNHDVDRTAATPMMLRQVATSEAAYSEWRQAPQFPHLETFFSWHRQLPKTLRVTSDWSAPLGAMTHVDVEGVPVNILALNSSALCCAKDDSGKLALDLRTINEELHEIRKRRGLVIAVAHHPVEELSAWNRDRVAIALAQEGGPHMLLYGHLHDQLGSSRANTTGARLTTLRGGAIYQSETTANQFAFYDIDVKKAKLTPRVYVYSKNSGNWFWNPELSRRITLDLGDDFQDPTPPEPAVLTVQHRADRQVVVETKTSGAGSVKTLKAVGTITDQITLQIARHREAGESVLEQLETFFNDIRGYNDKHFLSYGRVKKEKRIVEKISNGPLAGPHELSDVCGFRITTYFLSEIPSAVSEILHAVTSGGRDSPVIRSKPIEVRIYTSRPDDDEMSIATPVRQVAESFAEHSGLTVTIKQSARATGYSAVHLIFVTKPKADEHVPEMKIEIQVRSALEHVWSQIDHRLRYGSNRGGVGVSWQRHLTILKTMVDGVMQYLDEIKRLSDAEGIVPPLESKSAQSIEDPDTQLGRLKGLPPVMLRRVNLAYVLWKQADAARGAEPGKLRRAADAFASILEDYKREIDDDKSEVMGELLYVCRAERAFLLMYTGDEQDMATAESLYGEIIRESPENAENECTARFRIGQVKALRKRFDLALEEFDKALAILRSGRDRRVSTEHPVYDDLRLNIALTKWRLFSQSKDDEARVALLSDALALSDEVLRESAFKHFRTRALNDLLYYSWEERNAAAPNPFLSADIFRKYTTKLNDLVGDNIESYEYLDTLTRAFAWLEMHHAARDYAIRVRDRLERVAMASVHAQGALPARHTFKWTVAVSKFLNDDQQDALAYAMDVIDTTKRIDIAKGLAKVEQNPEPVG